MQNSIAWIVIIVSAALVGLFLVLSYMQPRADSQVVFWLHKDKILPDTVTTNAGLIRFVIHNSGPGEHGFAIEGPDGKRIELPHEAERLSKDAVFVFFLRLAPGKYTVYCPLRGHTGLGELFAPTRVKEKEVATLIVR
uniref:EfeO-type cupredoxin-like domain-containing protein n=1 Tax=Acetithermum autotrophicum TaxID=1446466 RepID=H5SVB7_ACEAU|nr:hypothetical protein HGMM_OP4C182 [Candidatus Acetothermum autotrophicum]